MKSISEDKKAREVCSVEMQEKDGSIEVSATLILHEVAAPDSFSNTDLLRVVEVAHHRAQELCKKLGYTSVDEVHFNGELWQAKLKI